MKNKETLCDFWQKKFFAAFCKKEDPFAAETTGLVYLFSQNRGRKRFASVKSSAETAYRHVAFDLSKIFHT